MARNDKFIDGLSVRPRNTNRRSLGMSALQGWDEMPTPTRRRAATKSNLAETNVVKSTTIDKLGGIHNVKQAPVKTAKKLVQILPKNKKTRRNEAAIARDFMQPVEAFEIGDALEPKTTEEITDVSELNSWRERRKKVAKKETEKAQKKEHKKWSIKRKVGVGVLALVLMGGGVAYVWGDAIISKLTGGRSSLMDAIGTVMDDKTVPLKTDAKGRSNILIYGTSGYEMDGSGHDGAQLTDSIMVMSLDQETKDVAMLNLPRDLLVDNSCTSTGKINEIYWCNNQAGNAEEAGAKALMSEVKDILGVDFQYYVHLNWGALVTLVDSIGGITVTLDEDIMDDWTNTYIRAGVPTTLNGEQALGLARARHGTEGGDFSRGNSQQKIMMALYQKIIANGVDAAGALGIVNSLGDNLRMSFAVDEVKSVAKVAKDADLANMRQVPLLVGADDVTYLTTAMIDGISYVVPAAGTWSYGSIQKYVTKMFSSDVAVRENAKILVLNGSGEPGVASAERSKLEDDGYTVGGIDDAPTSDYAQHYTLYVVNESLSGTQKNLEKRYAVKAQSAAEIASGVNTSGYDFVIIIGSSS